VASDNLWRRDLASGQMNHVYPLPQRVDGIEFIHVVRSYKHVGSIISSDLCWSQDAHLKYANAIAAYAPMAFKIYGSCQIRRETKIGLAFSLVFSRLLFDTQIWVVDRASHGIRTMNNLYMRVLRKIIDCSRFDSSCELTDEQVRRSVGVPSTDCLLMRRRLASIRWLLMYAPQSLLALMSARSGIHRQLMPWTAQIVADLKELQRCSCPKLDSLACPSANANDWASFILAFPSQWKELVDSLLF